MELGPRPKGYFMYKVLAGLLLIITFLVAASMIIARQNALDVPQAQSPQLTNPALLGVLASIVLRHRPRPTSWAHSPITLLPSSSPFIPILKLSAPPPAN